MATIRQMRGKWQVLIRKRFAKHITKSFVLKSDAEKYAREIESKIDQGILTTYDEAQDDLIEISKKHTDEDLKWIRDPNITKKEKRTKATLDQIEESQKKTLGEVIEVVCIKNFNEKDFFNQHFDFIYIA